MRRLMREYSFLLILIVLIREISLPYFMGFFSANSKIQLLSELGSNKFPFHQAFDRWEFIDGILFMLGAYYIYLWAQRQAASRYAKPLALLVALYGLGDCLLTSMFVYSGSTFANWHSFLHSIASVLGYLGLYLANLLIAKIKRDNRFLVMVIGISQLLNLGLNLLMESPLVTKASTVGLLQCVALDLMYLPLLILACLELHRKLALIRVRN